MRLFIQTFTICLAVSLCLATPPHHHHHHHHHHVKGDKSEEENVKREQCSHEHLDAITEDDDHDLFAFRGHNYLSKIDDKYYAGTIESDFEGLHDDIDAAFAHENHIHIVKDDKVYIYNISHTPGKAHKLRHGYPKSVKDALGLEGHIDAAFICPNDKNVYIIQGDKIYEVNLDVVPPTHTAAQPIPFKHVDTALCGADGLSVVIGDHFYHYESPNIFIAARILPRTQDVAKELLGCDKGEEEYIKREQCSHVYLDAVAEDDDHDLFAFRGHNYLSKIDDKYHAGTIESDFEGLHDDIDAAFAHDNHIHIVKDDKVYIYNISHTPGEAHKLRQGYPKSVKDALGLEGHIDAAFICPNDKNVYIIEGDKIYEVNLEVDPPTHTEAQPIPFKHVDTALCGAGGLSVVIDDHFYHYESPKILITARIFPPSQDVATELLGCDKSEEYIKREQCSHVYLDAVAEDDDHDLFAFRGHNYLSKIDDKYHAGTIESDFEGLHDDIDAAFAHDNHIHIVKDDKVYVYDISHTPGEAHKLRQGYPKGVKDALGLEGHIDAAFICPNDKNVYIIEGDKIYEVNLDVDPPTHTEAQPIPFKHVDTALCGADGLSVVIDDHFYHYESPNIFITARILPRVQDVATELLGCDKSKENIKREQCSHEHLDALAEDDDHDLFSFRGHNYLSKIDDKYHAGTIESGFEGLHDDIDAAFAHQNHIHIVKDDKVYIYNISHTPGKAHKLRQGYPKSVKDALGLEGHIDAAFICPNDKNVYIIQGDKIYEVNLEVQPPTHTEAQPIPFKHVDTALCGADGVSVVIGDHFYHYESPNIFITARIFPPSQDVATELLGCDKSKENIKREQCSHVHLDALAEDDDHDLFSFRGHNYVSKIDDKYHSGTIESGFEGLHDDIDAAFAHENHIHIVKDDNVYIYDISHTPGEAHKLRHGYPKSVKDALGLEGHIDAAFNCPNDKNVYIIQGDKIYEVSLDAEPPTHTEARPIPFKHVDAASCGADGVSVVIGDHFYHYKSPKIFITARILPLKQGLPKKLLGCKHHV